MDPRNTLPAAEPLGCKDSEMCGAVWRWEPHWNVGSLGTGYKKPTTVPSIRNNNNKPSRRNPGGLPVTNERSTHRRSPLSSRTATSRPCSRKYTRSLFMPTSETDSSSLSGGGGGAAAECSEME